MAGFGSLNEMVFRYSDFHFGVYKKTTLPVCDFDDLVCDPPELLCTVAY